MKKIFPSPRNPQTVAEQLKKVHEELTEFESAYASGDIEHAQMELVDVFHSVEWLVTSFQLEHKFDIDEKVLDVKEKNAGRGYYL